MTAPNIVNVTTITGKLAVANATTTFATVVSNAASSNTVYKINYISLSNSNSNSINSTVDVYRNGYGYPLISNISIPANSSLVVSGRDTTIYLEEGDTVRAYASSNSYVVCTSSYEIIG